MANDIFTLEARGIAVSLDLAVGHLAMLRVEVGGRVLEPLHRAPWLGDDEATFPEGTPPNVKRLSGDFFCAPFGRNDVEAAPSHGWPANSRWSALAHDRHHDRASATFVLEREVQGCRIAKVLRLVDGHPFLYQEHRLEGGEGLLSVSHHVMTRAAAGARLAFSPKRRAWTMETALEPDPARGRSALAYPASVTALDAFPRADGGLADLHAFPVAETGEDFVVLEEAGGRLGWTIVNRRAEEDALVVLKPGTVLPSTMLWMSHRGRDYAPWSGRHDGVLGIEDARADPRGHRASIEGGEATGFRLAPGRTTVIRHAIGVTPRSSRPDGFTEATIGDGQIVLSAAGEQRALPFDTEFL